MAEMLDFLFKINALYSGAPQVQQASAAITQLQQKTQLLQKTSANISGFQKQAAKLTELRTKLDNARMRVKTMQTTMRQGGQVDPKMFTRANQEAAKLQEQVIQNTKKLGEFRAELKNAGVDTSDLAGAQSRLQAQTDAMTRAQEKLNAAQSKMASLKSTLSWQGFRDNVIQPMLPVVGAIKAPVKLAADFEAAMARVKAVAFSNDDADMSKFAAMREQALRLGAETKFTSIQAAQAQENLARAGISPDDIMAAMPALLNMSAAEGMDISQAGAIIAKGLGGMGLDGSYAARFADILAYTSANSNTSIAMLGEAFKVVAPVMSSQGATMDQIAAYLGVIANTGYEGTEAGNALAAALLRLAKPTDKMKTMLNDLGVAIQTREGRMRELPSIMIALNDAMKKRNYGETQQLNVIETIFGVNYGKAMMAFMHASAAGKTGTMEQGIREKSQGRAKLMADINLDTLNGQLDILQSSWDGLRTTIGEMFSPAIRKGVELLSNTLSSLNNLMKEFPVASQAIVTGLTLIASAKAFKGVFDMTKALIHLPGAWMALKNAEKLTQLSTAAVDAGSLAANMGGAAKSAGLFGMSLNSALGWIGLIVSASVLVYQHWEDITAAAAKAGETFKQVNHEAIARQNSGVSAPVGSADYHYDAMMSIYSSPGLAPKKKNALGGIYHSPIWTWAAEAGPEAIIPLRNKSRGIPLLMQAAQILGLTQERERIQNTPAPVPTRPTLYDYAVSAADSGKSIYDITTVTPMNELGDNVRNYTTQAETTNRSINIPAVNLSVNFSGNQGQSENDIASLIASKVRDVLGDIMNMNERTAFA